MPGWCAAGSRRAGAPLLQPGNAVAALWRGRLAEHLGTLDCELVAAHAARLLDDPDRLAGLTAATALLLAALPEREPHPDLYASFARAARGASIRRAAWAARYVAWECDLLAALGFGLDLGRCAVTGTQPGPRLCLAAHRARGVARSRRAVP